MVDENVESPEDAVKRAEVMTHLAQLPKPNKVGGLYLHLFHGRINPAENLEDWGFEGPTIGPLKYVACTYMCHVKFEFENAEDAKVFGLEHGWAELFTHEDLLVYKNAYYGDWSVEAFDGHAGPPS